MIYMIKFPSTQKNGFKHITCFGLLNKESKWNVWRFQLLSEKSASFSVMGSLFTSFYNCEQLKCLFFSHQYYVHIEKHWFYTFFWMKNVILIKKSRPPKRKLRLQEIFDDTVKCHYIVFWQLTTRNKD